MKNRTGEKHLTKEGYTIEIIEYFRAINCTLQFEDGIIIKNRCYSDIVKGNIKNPNHKSVCNTGYVEIGEYNRKKNFKIYHTWQSMLERCYSKKRQEKFPTYGEVTVCAEWHNFQVFAQWFENNYNSETMEDWHLDKDILIKSNKIYSPENCVFIPPQINTLLIKCDSVRGGLPIGVSKFKEKFKAQISTNGKIAHIGYFTTSQEAFQAYKTAKENQIKCVANEWKDKITEKTYQALINYQVEITD